VQLVQLKANDSYFDYRIQVSPQGVLEGAIWMTGHQRRRLALFGDLVFFDATVAHVQENFQLFMPSILNHEKKLHRVCFAVSESENISSLHFILQSMMELCPH
jgi:hypothetical protein